MRKRSLEAVRFVSPSDMPYVQAVHGANVTNEFHRHVHERLCVGILLQGARVIWRAGFSRTIPENALFVINPGEAHTCKPVSGKEHSYVAIGLEMEKLKETASHMAGKARAAPYFASTLLQDVELAWKVRRLFSLLVRSDSTLARESAYLSMLSTLLTRHGDGSPPCGLGGSDPGLVNRLREFIRMQYSENLTLGRLSEVACLSPFHLQRVFLKTTGISPHDYLIQVRIKKAQELLVNGCGMAGVALDTGFVDQSHFVRSFKRVVGTTPGRYLRLLGQVP